MKEDNKILNTLAQTMFSTLDRQRKIIEEVEFIIRDSRDQGYVNAKVALECIELLIEENS